MRRLLKWTAATLVVVAAAVTFFVIVVLNPRLGSQDALTDLSVPADFNTADPRQVDALLGALADRLVGRPLNAGIAIGVTQGGRRHLVSRGVYALATVPSRPIEEDTLFEIGSLTKTFTGVLLAQAVVAEETELSESIQSLLPDAYQLSGAGRSITLAHLAGHASGLPSDPPSVSFLEGLALFGFPFGSVSDSAAFDSLRQASSAMSEADIGGYNYSNYGFMLLGRLLEETGRRPYAELVEQRLARPLGMNDTWVVPPPNARRRLATGHRLGREVEHWYEYQLPGAGGIVSTAPDLLRYAEAHLSPPDNPLGEAIALASQIRTRASEDVAMGLGWHIFTREEPFLLYHNGSSMGFRSYIGVVPDLDLGIVVLGNSRDSTINAIGRLLMRTWLAAAPAGQ